MLNEMDKVELGMGLGLGYFECIHVTRLNYLQSFMLASAPTQRSIGSIQVPIIQ